MTHNNPAPAAVKYAAALAAVHSVLGLAYAVLLLYRQFTGADDPSLVSEKPGQTSWVGLGTAVFFIIVFGAVLAAAVVLLRSTHPGRWPRGPIVILELILLPIAVAMIKGGAWPAGIATGISAAASLALMFSKPALDWATATYDVAEDAD
ncbi:hypothetical protein ACUY3K_07485 [Corynebacterium uberis]|uniref:hypothetical protein n=1 Tax=Corynebacterium uberis TaxID=2883169 RepID=UPI001D09E1DF|nr:hypothetical protein [Corynebacterium uberis]UDL76349.1 hypothetical protein LH393_02880 [Corynebacterium uberis]UDL78561.1 hypothetical protein LH394_02865 [Corynebacterium uberis]UDL80842.1 hypothetical protein LH392_03295 [Corynebacterium uberis]UDL85185.1 hypothetical protein LH390_02870 [Corynebacterium uberis]